MKRITLLLLIIIILLVSCSGIPDEAPTTEAATRLTTSSPQPTQTETPLALEPAAETVAQTATPLATETPAETAAPTAAAGPSPTPFPVVAVEPDWSGDWEVYIANPRISIVKVIQFNLPTGEERSVKAEWYEGTRLVYLDAVLSENGRTITGTFWNSDVEMLDVVLTLSPDATYFTGTADSPNGPGQFCGARPGNPRPDPCRGDFEAVFPGSLTSVNTFFPIRGSQPVAIFVCEVKYFHASRIKTET